MISVYLTKFAEWFFRTRMSFYGHDLELPWWFGACCWNYLIGGAVMLWTTEPRWMKESRQFPWRVVAWLLILVQGPLSFSADYLHMEQDSYWHVVDRCLSLPLMTMEVFKFYLICQHTFHFSGSKLVVSHQKRPITSTTTLTRSNHKLLNNASTIQTDNKSATTSATMHPLVVSLYGISLIFAVLAFVQSTRAQARLDRDAFCFWHTAWHVYPLLASGLVLLDFYADQGWQRSTRKYFYAVEWHCIGQQRRQDVKSS